MRFYCFGYLLGTLVLSLMTPPTIAQPTPLGDEFRVNTTTAGDQADPKVAMDADGNFVVVWVDGSLFGPVIDGSSANIAAQRYDSSGAPVGDEFIVNTYTTGAQTDPSVAMDHSGNFVVAWANVPLDYGGLRDVFGNITGQRFASDGTPVGEQFQANNMAEGFQDEPAVAMGNGGEFIVSWNDGLNDHILARPFNSHGDPITDELQVATARLGGEIGLDTNPTGDFVVVWRVPEESIEARIYDSSGVPQTDVVRLETDTSGKFYSPGLAMGPNGDFVVAWPTTLQSSSPIVARRFDSAGAPVGDELQVSTTTTTFARHSMVAMDASGHFSVVWTSPGQDGDSAGVFGQQFDNTGTPIGEEFQVNSYTAGSQGYGTGPDIAMAEHGNFVVVWQDEGYYPVPGQDGDGSGIYAQRYGGTGSDPALVGHWPFDEGSGTTAANSSSNGLDGTLEDGAQWTAGQRASAVLFDGVDDLVRVVDSGAGSQLDVTDALTLAFWVRPDAVDGSTQVLLSKDNAYELEFGKLGASTLDLRLDNAVAAAAATPVEEGVWQHLAVTWDGATITFYYNGLEDSSTSHTGTLTPNDNALGLGARPSLAFEGGPVFHFQGALDEFYVFDRALDATEIANLMLADLTDIFPPARSNLAPVSALPLGAVTADLTLETDGDAECRYDTNAGTPFAAMANTFSVTGGTNHSSTVPVTDGAIYVFHVRCQDTLGNTNGEDARIAFGVDDADLCGGLVSHWMLDEGTGCSTADSAGINPGTLGPNCPSNAPTWTTGREAASSALAFDGGDDAVEITSPTGLSSLGEVTMAAWIQHDASGIFRSIVDRRDAGNNGFNLYLEPSSRLFMRINSTTITGNTVVADGQWHHVVGVYDDSSLELYVDGQLDASTTASAGTLDVSGPLVLGRNYATTQFSFAGTLDGATVYGRGLSPVEVLELYTAGTPACTP